MESGLWLQALYLASKSVKPFADVVAYYICRDSYQKRTKQIQQKHLLSKGEAGTLQAQKHYTIRKLSSKHIFAALYTGISLKTACKN